MAIYHLHAQIISRKDGRSAVACAAYRSGERLIDERYNKEHDYTRKEQVRESYILAPEGSPEWVKDREQLWNQVEASEKRVDAQLARELDIALPSNLDHEQQKSLVNSFVKQEFVERGMVADVAIHDGAKGEQLNPHAHVMLTMRGIEAEGFGKKVREWNDRSLLKEVRQEWALSANRHMELAGREERIDHRTLKAQGIDREPTTHQGVWQTREIRQIERQLKAIEKIREVEREQGEGNQRDRDGSENRGTRKQAEKGLSQGRGPGADEQRQRGELTPPSSVADIERALQRTRAKVGKDIERSASQLGPESGPSTDKQRDVKPKLERDIEHRDKKHPGRRKEPDIEIER